MKKTAFILCTLLLSTPLFPQGRSPLPVIGTCTTDSLRIRSFHDLDTSQVVGSFDRGEELVVLGTLGEKLTVDGRTADWYLVLKMNGIIGWSFGGYIDAGSTRLPVVGADPDYGAEAEDFDILGSEGVACRKLRFSASSSPQAQAVFLKPPRGRPQIIFLRPGYSEDLGDSELNEVKAVDYFKDGTKELCLRVTEGSGDSVAESLYVYGRSPEETRYRAYGTIGLSFGAGGGGWDFGSGTSLSSGPTPFFEGKRSFLRLLTVSFETTPSADRGDGERYRTILRQEHEIVYEFTGSALVFRTDRVVEEVSTEEKWLGN